MSRHDPEVSHDPATCLGCGPSSDPMTREDPVSRDWMRKAELQDAIIEAVRSSDGVAGVKAFQAYDDFLAASPADGATYIEVHTTACHAGSDGDCSWSECPQTRDGEPRATGRHCPLDAEAVKPWAASPADGAGVDATAQQERFKWRANERADRLAEACRPLLSWAEAVRQHHAMLRTEPPFTTTAKLDAAIDGVYAVLAASPADGAEPETRRTDTYAHSDEWGKHR